MKYWMIIFAIVCPISLNAKDLKSMVNNPDYLVESYESEKSNVNELDTQSREIMSALYEINMRMKGVSKKRDDLNNKVMSTEIRVKGLTKEAVKIENQSDDQKHLLSRRLRAIYMLGDEGVARIIFSSADSVELGQNLKYLKIISNQDFGLIRSYEKNLKKLNAQKEILRKEVTRLMKIKNELKENEKLLSEDQDSKSNLLAKLGNRRKISIKKIMGLRDFAKEIKIEDMLNLSFFEQKGQLKPPVAGTVLIPYGLTENQQFHYQLGHKGLTYKVKASTDIKSIFNGRVAFNDWIDGYGQTVIIDHGDHYYSVYSNAVETKVRQGQQVAESQVIAKSQGEFYFEIRHFSDAIDPENWIN